MWKVFLTGNELFLFVTLVKQTGMRFYLTENWAINVLLKPARAGTHLSNWVMVQGT